MNPSPSQPGSPSSASAPEIPFVKGFSFEYGRPDIVAPGVKRVIANNPGPFTYTGSGTYIISNAQFTAPAAIIDPGPEDPAHLEAVLAATREHEISHILVTHTHSDHCGGARALGRRTDAPILSAGAHPVGRCGHRCTAP